MKVAIYSRFSTDTQDVTSIAGQVANCEALVESSQVREEGAHEIDRTGELGNGLVCIDSQEEFGGDVLLWARDVVVLASPDPKSFARDAQQDSRQCLWLGDSGRLEHTG